MWVVIIIIAIIILVFILASLGSNNTLYNVYDENKKNVYLGNAKQCADYIQLMRDSGYKGRFKTKRYK